jgi:hypothetical protein
VFVISTGNESATRNLKLVGVPFIAFFVYRRLKNMGCHGAWALVAFGPMVNHLSDFWLLLILLPLSNLILQVFVLSAPPGYGLTRKYDVKGIVIACTVVLLIAALIGLYMVRKGRAQEKTSSSIEAGIPAVCLNISHRLTLPFLSARYTLPF